MSNVLCLLLLVGSLLFCSSAQPVVGVECGTSHCIAGEECCGEAESHREAFSSIPNTTPTISSARQESSILICFNPNTHSCVNGTLCPLGEDRCGGACFDSTKYTCGKDSVGGDILCPKGMNICGTGCFNAMAYKCNKGEIEYRFDLNGREIEVASSPNIISSIAASNQ